MHTLSREHLGMRHEHATPRPGVAALSFCHSTLLSVQASRDLLHGRAETLPGPGGVCVVVLVDATADATVRRTPFTNRPDSSVE